jgi:hypothetical protein
MGFWTRHERMNEARWRLACACVAVVIPICSECDKRGGGDAPSPRPSTIALTAFEKDASAGAGQMGRVEPGAVGIVPARCRPEEPGLSFGTALGGAGGSLSARGASLGVAGDGGPPRPLDPGALGADDAATDVEIGDAIAEEGGYAVSVIHPTPAGRTCAVAHLGAGARGPIRLVELGPTLGDAPPARLVRKDTELLAAAYGIHHASRAGESTRELVVYALADAGPTSRATLAQQRDDSLAFDIASSGRTSLVVWDEAATGPRGVIRSAILSSDEPTGFGAPRDVSPSDRDAETPRMVFTASRFVVFWLARRPESALDAAVEQHPSEALGEARTFGWLESVDLDEHGVPLGAPRALTSTTGHVSAYDVTALEDGSVLVVARDDGEAIEGSGGRLLRMRMTASGVEPPLAFAIDGLGRGGPALVDGLPHWLAWVGPREQLRMLPLDEIGAPAGPSSAEDAMSDGRPLLALDSPAGVTRELLVAFPSHADAQVRRFACTR